VTDSWTDPASLQGDALTQWYLRSPAGVERERQAAAAQRYQDFFHGGSGNDPDPGFGREVPASSQDIDPGFAIPAPASSEDIDPGFTWVPAGPNRWRSVKVEEDSKQPNPISFGPTPYGGPMPALGGEGSVAVGPPSSSSGPETGRSYIKVAATSPGFWDYWSPRGCANCHGYTPGALPPVGGQSPFPPNYSPRSGGASGSGGSQPHRDKKECDQQYDSDSQICGRLKSPRDVAICRATASERYAYCLRPDGTIGFPHLETKGGRRP